MSFVSRAFGKVQDTVTRALYGVENQTSKMSFYSCADKNMQGEEVKMSSFKGDVLLLVNVASKWGVTKKNYDQLPVLYDEYAKRGFKILAFPSNQFGAQEPGTHEEIIEFVKKFDSDMPNKLIFFEKTDVNGANAREVYSFIKPLALNSDDTTDIRWNFAKFLIDHEGKPYKRYNSTAPFDMKEDIEMLLKKKEEVTS